MPAKYTNRVHGRMLGRGPGIAAPVPRRTGYERLRSFGSHHRARPVTPLLFHNRPEFVFGNSFQLPAEQGLTARDACTCTAFDKPRMPMEKIDHKSLRNPEVRARTFLAGGSKIIRNRHQRAGKAKRCVDYGAPKIDRVMQVRIRKQRNHHTPLRRASISLRFPSIFMGALSHVSIYRRTHGTVQGMRTALCRS
jgi:hypothetical protein